MKNVKNVYPVRGQRVLTEIKRKQTSNGANYWQFDHKVKKILEVKGITILPSPQAWERFIWTRKWFGKKPKEGYFIWVKEQTDFPLTTCVTIASPKISQNLTNLLVIEKNIKTEANVLCNAAKGNLCGSHRAQGKLILKEGSFLKYNHFHKWGEKDLVEPNYEFILEKDSKLIYNYQNLLPPKNLRLITAFHNKENSSVQANFVINSLNSKTELKESIFLEGKNSQGILKLRLVGKKEGQIEAKSTILATSPSRGHLDCQGLLVDRKSKISLIPELICQNKLAQITHEASIGRISEEELNYLRMRGLSEEEAINLIVSGFLKS